MRLSKVYEDAEHRLERNEITLGEFERLVDIEVIEPKRGENLNNKYADCDQFICSECGIELRDWTRVEVDEDDGEEYHYEYIFRFCPNCGAKMGEREGE